MKHPPKILLTAPPGTGKSTAIKAIVAELRQRGLTLLGFFTEEVLDNAGVRLGFDLVDVNGSGRAPLSRIGLESTVMIEQYGVDLAALAAFLPLINSAADITVIDEIGNMQLASPAFCELVQTTIAGNNAVLGTVHVFQQPVTDELKQRQDISIIAVTAANRDSLPSLIVDMFG